MKKKSVDIVIPVYNEEAELEKNVRVLHRYCVRNLTRYAWKIVIADNASTDRTWMIAKRLSKSLKNLSVVHLDQKGRGRAVKTAWRQSKASFVMYMDIDLSTDLKSIRPLFRALESGYDIAIGSRLKPGSRVVGRTVKREIMSRVYNILIKLFFSTRFSDAQCGFKAVTRRVVNTVLNQVQDEAWFFDSEMLIIAEKSGYRIYEEPVYWVDNPGSTVRVLGTVRGDLEGLFRLFISRPWRSVSI